METDLFSTERNLEKNDPDAISLYLKGDGLVKNPGWPFVILTILRKDGWFFIAIRGSHRQFKHPVKSDRITVAGKPGDDLAHGTLNSIFKQAGLKE
jgi:predicted RNA binding protein YcfA (HicA-like mRNA interferase family)